MSATAGMPYGRHTLTSRLSLWGVAGHGTGTLALTPDGQPSLETDIDLAMAAVGLRSVLLKAPAEGGPELADVGDVMGVRPNSDADLKPRPESGVRRDGGDAETGTEVDVGPCPLPQAQRCSGPTRP